MIRMALSGVIGLILFYIESVIVMQLKGTGTIEFGGIAPFINIWAMNFFFVFAILIQLGNWFESRMALEKGEKDDLY
ncbi:hypothetical protein ACF5W4_03510 [Bacillota bacterium Lsc_1132]